MSNIKNDYTRLERWSHYLDKSMFACPYCGMDHTYNDPAGKRITKHYSGCVYLEELDKATKFGKYHGNKR